MSVAAKCLAEGQFSNTTATTLYTAPAGVTTIIDKLSALNSDAATRTLSIYIVPSGQAVGDQYLVAKAVSMLAGTLYDSSEMKNQILNTGDSVVVTASVANVVTLRVSGRECS
jgi:hypothetical protein